MTRYHPLPTKSGTAALVAEEVIMSTAAKIAVSRRPSRKGITTGVPRCPCGVMTAARAVTRRHKC